MATTEVTSTTETNKYTYFLENLIHILVLFLLFYILWIPIHHFKNLLSWHAIIGTIAFLFLMSESITLLSSNPGVTKFLTTTKEKKIWSHGILFTIATSFAVISVFLEYYRKDRKYKQHFHTAHGITALMATIFTVVAFLSGLVSSKSHLLPEIIRPVAVKLFHNLFGVLAFGLGMLSLSCAYFSNWFVSYTLTFERIVLVFITLIITSWILIHAVKSLFQQIKSV